LLGVQLTGEFEELDELALDACRIIAAEMKSGGRWDVGEGRLDLPEG
jgi:hypothetical protein